MLRIVKKETTIKDTVVEMGDLEPFQIGIIVDTDSSCKVYKGHLVMRTASTDKFEVMDISEPKEDMCWTDDDTSLKVRRLHSGEKVTL